MCVSVWLQLGQNMSDYKLQAMKVIRMQYGAYEVD